MKRDKGNLSVETKKKQPNRHSQQQKQKQKKNIIKIIIRKIMRAPSTQT